MYVSLVWAEFECKNVGSHIDQLPARDEVFQIPNRVINGNDTLFHH